MRTGHASPIGLALAVWLCTLPVVFLLVAPRLGAGTAVAVALAVLAAIGLVCWAACSRSAAEASARREHHR
jgi:hypothetical protein